MRKPMLMLAVAATITMDAMPAHAYIDPGTGSLIVQSIIGGAAAAITVGGLYLSRIRNGLNRLIGRDPGNGSGGGAPQ